MMGQRRRYTAIHRGKATTCQIVVIRTDTLEETKQNDTQNDSPKNRAGLGIKPIVAMSALHKINPINLPRGLSSAIATTTISISCISDFVQSKTNFYWTQLNNA